MYCHSQFFLCQLRLPPFFSKVNTVRQITHLLSACCLSLTKELTQRLRLTSTPFLLVQTFIPPPTKTFYVLIGIVRCTTPTRIITITCVIYSIVRLLSRSLLFYHPSDWLAKYVCQVENSSVYCDKKKFIYIYYD